MSFEYSHRTVFMVYRALGLVPFQFHLQSAKRLRWRTVHLFVEYLWFVCMLLIELYMLIHTCILCFDHSVRVSFDVFRTLHFSIVTTVRTLVIVITIESYCQRNSQVKILNKFREIDRKFKEKLNFEMNHRRLRQRIMVSFVTTILIYITAIIFLILLYWSEPLNQQVLGLFVIYPLLKRTLSGASYMTYALLAKYRIEAMHEILNSNLLLAPQRSIEVCLDRWMNHDNEMFEMRRLISLQTIYSELYDIVHLINNSFKWSISANFPINVFDISVAIFSAFDVVMAPETPHVIYVSYTWAPLALHYAFSLASIVRMADSLNKEADKLSHQIHRIQSCGIKSQELTDLVSNRKSLQLTRMH